MRTYTLRNASGIEARIADVGGILLSLCVPDRNGRPDNIVVGFPELEDYHENPDYTGALIGRYAGRIAHGRFTLEGRTVRLSTNHGEHHLHGGTAGFHGVIWAAEPSVSERGDSLVLMHTSPDGHEGYPGTLNVRVTYTLTDDDDLIVDYHATTDRATPVNLTHHSYFNLAGGGDILEHVLMLNAQHVLVVNEALIPTGEIRAVEGGPFDFRTPTRIGARIGAADPQLRFGAGYDHTFVLDKSETGALTAAARVVELSSGRVLEVQTTEPAVHFYSGNMLRRGARSGFALETQHFPDAPNHAHFPNTILRPGETYASRTVYTFGIVG